LCDPGTTVIDVDRIVIDPAIMGGVPCIAGTRIPVTTILGLLREGTSPAEIVGYYPQLVNDDVLACVQYAASAGGQQGFDQRTPPPRDE
jgi:uncharacterized protein (DUF433 family)